MGRALVALAAVICTFVSSVAAYAKAPAPDLSTVRTLTLQDALRYAADHYPAIRAAMEQVNASDAGVHVAKAGYLPRLDSVYQVNRGTANNVFGQVLPQSVMPSLSGPVLASASNDSVWGSAAGALLSWEALDFGLRAASVRGAEADLQRARADASLARLEVESAVASAFLAAVQADEAVAATRADVERRDVLAHAAHALADNELRPGAEASRADAERAAAATRWILARREATLAQATLTRVLGITAGAVTATALPAAPAATGASDQATSTHPLAQAREAAVDVARAQEDLLAHTDRPRIVLQSSVFARGTGANVDGSFSGGTAGLGFDRANWAAGVQVIFPNVFDVASLHARRQASAAALRAESARYDEAVLAVTSEQRAAAAMVDAAREVAANTPVQVAAARQSEAQARARYQAGLASIVEVADAQELLAQAEYQDAVAAVDVWRALLAEAVARGDLAPFVTALAIAGGGR